VNPPLSFGSLWGVAINNMIHNLKEGESLSLMEEIKEQLEHSIFYKEKNTLVSIITENMISEGDIEDTNNES